MALIVEIKVIPSADRNRCKWEHGRLKCYVKSPPAQGRANDELIRLIAKAVKLPITAVVLLSGATSRIKRVKIDAPISLELFLQMLGIEQQLSLFKGK